jgi:ABC-type transporter Mla subunit MlaD
MPRVPGFGDILAVLQAQTEALAALPSTAAALNRSVRGLSDAVNQMYGTVTTVHRLAARMDGLLDEIEEPLKDLAPGLRRVAATLDDPVVETLPDSIRQLSEDVLPLVRDMRDTHAKVATMASSTERLLAVVDGAGRSLATPAAALFGLRRGGHSGPRGDASEARERRADDEPG